MKPDDPKAPRDSDGRQAVARCASISTGIARRVAAFPVPEGRFDQIAGVAGDKVVWTLMPIVGAHGRGGHKDSPGRLEIFDFEHAEGRNAVRQGGPVRRRRRSHDARAARRQAAARDSRRPHARPARARDAGVRRAVAQERLDRSRAHARCRSIRAREWRQMLREVWRLQRDQFWVPDMSGIDWEARLRALRAAARARRDARRTVRPHLGDAGRARHVARVRNGRRSSPAAVGRRSAISRADLRARRRWRELRDRAHRRGRPVGRRRGLAAERDRRAGEGRRAHRRRQRPAGVARAPAAGAARAPGEHEGRADARDRRRRRRIARTVRRHDARRRNARALSRMGRAQSRVGARQVERPRRLPAPARHDVRGLRGIPPLLRHRMRPRCADRRRPLQPRRPRVAAAAGESRARAARLRPDALGPARAVSGRIAGRARSSRSPTSTRAPTATSSRTASS